MNLCAIIGTKGPIGLLVADAFIALLREACDRESPHELDVVRRRGIDGEIRDVRVFPARWARRLEAAYEKRAFYHMSVEEIVKRILTTDQPTDAEAIAS